jgi:diaminopimelate epimerase
MERMTTQFYKYQALGNDMIVIDPAVFPTSLTGAKIRFICDRHFGPGADGICYGPLPGHNQHHTMRFFNPDGSESEKSGHGLRIFARYLWDAGYVKDSTFTIAIHQDIVQAQLLDEAAHTIAMQIGRLSFHSPAIPVSGPPREVVEEEIVIGGEQFRVTAVSLGNPHCVIFTDDLDSIHTFGPTIEAAALFPNRTNVQFGRVLDPHTIQIEIWERGAGYTLASGTSCSAVAGAAIRTGRCQSPVEVRMAGGSAHVAIDNNWQVTLTGTVAAVYQGSFAPDWLQQFAKQ